FDPQDTSLAAQKARRACRLEAFEQRLASERQKTLAAAQDAQDAWVDKWMGSTQPARVINPIAIELYGGYGITSYGLVASWTVLQGDGRANSLNPSAGVQFAVGYLRLSVEYVFEYLIYTGANLNDMQKTPSEDLRLVWEDSLNQDRHGVRFQVGFAF